MLRFCFVGIAFLAALNLSLAEDYEIETDGFVDAAHHLIPDSKPLHFIDHSSSVGKFSIVDVINPMTSLIPSDVTNNKLDAEKTLKNSSCLTLVLADNLKEHITPDNLQPVTVLLQHSLESCPGLKSTFEILQKMMDIKGMNIDEAIEFIQKLTIIQSGENDEGQEVEHETSEVESKNVTPTQETDADDSEFVHDTATTEEQTDEKNHYEEVVTENDETNVEPSEAPELDNTNPLDAIQSVLSMLEEDPQYSSFLTENDDDVEEEADIAEDPVPVSHELPHETDTI